MFNNSHREKSETCVIAQENKTNKAISTYITKNEKMDTDDVEKAALSQPTLLYSDGHVGPEGIAVGTSLRIGEVGTLNEPQPLCYRSNSVFYEESNLKDVSTESSLRIGATVENKRSTEGQQPDNFVPLIPSVKENIQDPQNIIPEMNSESFTRFGISTRLNKKPIER